jgi:hypothetical protein
MGNNRKSIELMVFRACLGFITLPLVWLSLSDLRIALAEFQGSRNPVSFRNREPNVHAPTLYADKLTMKVTLVNLPGAESAGSSWEVSYRLFFIPEDKYYADVQKLPPGGSSPGPEQFRGKILLAEGQVKKTELATIQNRTYIRGNIPFKFVVPDNQRTKFARLMTAYSVKVFDAKLNTSVYRSGTFANPPFDNPDPSNAIQRDTLYLNFMVSPTGDLYRSHRPRKDGDTTWED